MTLHRCSGVPGAVRGQTGCSHCFSSGLGGGGPYRVSLITSAAQGLYLTPRLLGPHDLGGPPGAQLLQG